MYTLSSIIAIKNNMIKPIRILIAIVLLFFLTILLFTYFNRKNTRKESQNLNLVIISVDTLRADHMGIYGYVKNTTPNIDKWAKEAFVFTNAITTIPQTYPSFMELNRSGNPKYQNLL